MTMKPPFHSISLVGNSVDHWPAWQSSGQAHVWKHQLNVGKSVKWQVSLHVMMNDVWASFHGSDVRFFGLLCFLSDGCRRFIYWFCSIGNLPMGRPPHNMNVAYRKPMILVRSQLLAHRSDPENDESAIVGWSLKICHLARATDPEMRVVPK